MTETHDSPVHAEVRYEKSDAQARGIIAFGIMLIVMGVLVNVTCVWLFDHLRNHEDEKYKALPSLAARERVALPQDLDRIPSPRLQKSEPADLARQRAKEKALLTTYGWVDRSQGTVRIPIDEAMQMLADPKIAQAKGIRVYSPKEKK